MRFYKNNKFLKELNKLVAKVRQDAWTNEDDLLLAETVLRHIREGSTQLNAFEEVGDILNRTSAACGFRWNAEVRGKYVQAIELAKRQRKEKKRQEANRPTKVRTRELTVNHHEKNNLVLESDLNLTTVIHYLQTLQYDVSSNREEQSRIEALTEENNRLQTDKDTLKKELTKLQERLETVEEDYKAFIQIMDRARKLTLLDDQGGTLKSPTFRMDQNGNLEQLNQS